MYDDFSIGGGISYRLGIKEEFSSPGINLEFYYYFIDYFRSGIDLTYYIVDGNFSPSAFEANINVCALFFPDRYWSIYGLAGIQFIWIEYDWGEEFGKDKHYGFGFNLGGSVEYNLEDNFKIFAEPKITLYCIDKFRMTPNFTLGVRYFF